MLALVRRARPAAHAAILIAVLGAVGCSVSTQYGVKFLVDVLSAGRKAAAIWLAFAVLVITDRRRQLCCGGWRAASQAMLSSA